MHVTLDIRHSRIMKDSLLGHNSGNQCKFVIKEIGYKGQNRLILRYSLCRQFTVYVRRSPFVLGIRSLNLKCFSKKLHQFNHVVFESSESFRSLICSSRNVTECV